MSSALPQEMEQHTYGIMDEVEGSHWWFVGRRAILESFLRQIAERLSSPPYKKGVDAALGGRGGSFSPNDKAIDGNSNTLRILDVGCGTGANLEMLAHFGAAEGVDVSDDALEFCRRKGLKVQKGLAETLAVRRRFVRSDDGS